QGTTRVSSGSGRHSSPSISTMPPGSRNTHSSERRRWLWSDSRSPGATVISLTVHGSGPPLVAVDLDDAARVEEHPQLGAQAMALERQPFAGRHRDQLDRARL